MPREVRASLDLRLPDHASPEARNKLRVFGRRTEIGKDHQYRDFRCHSYPFSDSLSRHLGEKELR